MAKIKANKPKAITVHNFIFRLDWKWLPCPNVQSIPHLPSVFRLSQNFTCVKLRLLTSLKNLCHVSFLQLPKIENPPSLEMGCISICKFSSVIFFNVIVYIYSKSFGRIHIHVPKLYFYIISFL